MKAAFRAGSRGLGMCDAFSAEELSEAGAVSCFESLSEVRAWIKQHR